MLCDQYVFDALKYRIEISGTGTHRYYNKDDKLHRTDGPAVEYANGGMEWWVDGVKMSKEAFADRASRVIH